MPSPKPSRKNKADSKPKGETFRLLFANHPVPMWVYDLKTLAFLDVNDAALEKYGYARDEFLTLTIKDISPAEDAARLINNLKQKRSAQQHSGEWRHCLKNGQVIEVEIASHTLEFEGYKAALVMAQDITERKQAEKALHESEARYRDLVENSPDLICTHDLEGSLLFVNEAGTKISGYSNETLLKMNLRDVLAPEVRDRFDAYLAEIQEKGQAHGLMRIQTTRGEIRYLEFKNTLQTEFLNAPIVRAMARDVTERKRTEEALQKSEASLQAVLQSTADGILAVGCENEVLYANQRFVEMWRISQAAIASKDDSVLLQHTLDQLNDPQSFLKKVQELYKSQKESFDTLYFKDGRVFERQSRPLLHGTELRGRVWSFRDVTERKQAEEKLRILSRAVEQSPASIVITDVLGNIEYVNPKFSEITGYSLGEVLGKNPRILQSGNTTEAEYKKLWDTITSGNVWHSEFMNKKKNGEKYWENATITPVFDDHGKITNFLSLKEDITKRKQAEEAWRESEEKYRLLVDQSPYAISIHQDGKIRFVNRAAIIMMGAQSADELIGRPISDIVYPDGLDAARDRIQRMLQGETGLYPVEDRYVQLDGSQVSVEVSAAPFTFKGRPAIQVIAVDITERKLAEEKLRKSEALFASLFHANPTRISITRFEDSRFLDVNETFLKSIGYTREEVVGFTSPELNDWVDPQERVRLRNLLKDQGRVKDFETQLRKKSGDIMDILISAELIELFGETCILSVGLDITERKRAEIEIKERTEELELINELNEAVNRGDSLDKAIGVFSRELRKISVSRDATIYLLSPDEKSLAMQSLSLSPTLIKKIEQLIGSPLPQIQIPIKEGGYFQHALQSEQGIITADPKIIQEWMLEFTETKTLPAAVRGTIRKLIPQIYKLLDIRSTLTLPLVSDKKIIGLLDVSSAEILTEKDLHRIQKITGQLTAVILREQANEALLESEKRYRSIFDGVQDAIFIETKDGRILEVNNRACEMYGYKQDEFLTKTVPDFVVEGSFVFAPHLKQPNSSSAPIETINRRANGELFPIEISGGVQVINGEEVNLVIIRDITERKQAEFALEESQRRLVTLMANLPGMAFRCKNDHEWSIDFVSEGCYPLTGYHPAELINSANLTYGQIIHSEDRQMVWDTIQAKLEEKQPYQLNYRIITASGEERWVWEQGQGVYEADGVLLALEGFIADITERKRADDELRQSEERFQQLANNIEETFWITDAGSGKEIYISPAAEKIWGIPVENLYQGQYLFLESILPEDRQIALDAIERQSHGAKTEMEYRIQRPDGSVRWIWDRAFPIVDETGKVLRVAGLTADITEHKQSEEALHESEERFRVIFEKANDAIHIEDANDKILAVNSRMCELMGYSREELLKMRVADLQAPELRQPGSLLKNELALHGSTVFEALNLHRDGRRIPVEISIGLIERPSGDLHISIVRDITERKQAERNIRQRVRELELLYQSGLEFSQLLKPKEIAQKIIDLLGEKLDWHHTTIRLIRAQDELELLAFNQPGLEDKAQAQAVETHFNNLITHIGEGLSGWALQQSKTIRLGDVTSDPHYVAIYPGIHSGLYVPLKSGNRILGVISIESEQPNAFSESDEQLLTTLANQAANAFENARLFQTARQEIIERKRVESLLADERNQLAERVEERTADLSRVNADLAHAVRVKDEFLASMSHELRTPLTGILGLSEVLQLKIYGELNDKQSKTLKNIEESGRHLLDLINDILDLSKIEAGKLELQFAPYSLTDICQASLQLIKGMAQYKNQNVHYSPPTETIIVRVDARRLKQALVNLLSNAIKFTPQNGEFGLEVEAIQSERKIKLTVWDKGIGIKPEDLNKLFKPFTQLDSGLAREYSGTGLGLSLVQRLIELHNGGIEVESNIGKGSRFTVILPWSPQNTTPIPYILQHGNTGRLFSSVTSPENSKSPLVMYVDDNEMVLQMVSDFLEAKQYRVMKVRSGAELLERAAEHHPNIMLVDIQMSGIGGMETIRRIRAHPDPLVAAAPVIAVTALAMPADRERCLRAGANDYMSKPLKLKELAAAIPRLLERKQ